MDENELKKIYGRIELQIKKKGIVDDCQRTVLDYGEVKEQVYSYHTTIEGEFSEGPLEIKYYSNYGRGNLRVRYNGKKVLETDSSTSKDVGVPYPYVDGREIQLYLPGQWETDVRAVLKNKGVMKKIPARQVKPKPKVLEETVVDDAKSRFGFE